ncbi:xanthine dehydrogenase family protein molybdopterin-binding subunit [Leisingera sp. ANG-Vp]|uniref:xanthine dehydrogenase family protein molybdopterin-binding subunit n=1 Tax=Leisingera sp. ANG-Vp TaxID=1577896 RepID=UPI00057F2211|nr:molybdopterin cofactor-binding domain-containing protein [Leisingera sp. ANG-Vp]KIC21493.1 hypothetical protein RA20_03875 [Leisingera sp. ANG-Vp]
MTHSKETTLSRRSVLKGIAGLTAFFALPVSVRPVAAQTKLPFIVSRYPTVDAWIRIDPEGIVHVFSGKAELGQGIQTAITQIVAEELDLPVELVRMVDPDTGVSPEEFYTAGSTSIETSGMALRHASAEIRDYLVGMAAEKAGVEKSGIRAENGELTASNGVRTTYWSLVEGQEINFDITGEVAPKAPSEFQLVGKPQPRIDLPAKFTGEASYISDIRLPGMVHGRVVRPPAPVFSLTSVASGSVEAMEGVISVVRNGSFLGVVAEREDQAVAAAEALAEAAEWDIPKIEPSMEDLPEQIKSLPSTEEVFVNEGDVSPAGGQRFEAAYFRPFHAHAAVSPSCALAQFEGETLTVWSHTQGVFPARRDMANALSMPEENVRVIHAHGAGCFGHNGADDVAMDAALLARATGRPVRVMWSRQDELAHSPFGSAMRIEISAELGADAKLRSYDHTVWSGVHGARPGFQFYMQEKEGSGFMPIWSTGDGVEAYAPRDIPPMFGGGAERNGEPIYDIPNRKLTKYLLSKMPLRVSAMRGLGAYANHFAMESFIDEVAFGIDADPVEFRLRHLSDPRYRAVVERAAEAANWTGRSTRKGYGRGFSFGRYKNRSGIFAIVVDVNVDLDSGEVAIPKVAAAVDVGQVINPDGVINQIEGGIIQSLSWTMMEEVAYDGAGITSTDWSSYPILSVAQAPEVDIRLIDRPDMPPVGAGEASQGPTASALANAIFDATGARVRDMPLRPEKILAAMQA